MAEAAVHVSEQLAAACLRVLLDIGMDMRVMSEMLGTLRRLMLAVGRGQSPGQLERQQHSNEDRDQVLHLDRIIAAASS